MMLPPTFRLFFVCLLILAAGLRAQSGSCTLNSAQTIAAAFADLQAAQPVPEGALLNYCVRTNSLTVPTATIEFTTNQGSYPFLVRITDVADQSVQVLTAFGDLGTVDINRVYDIEFEALMEGTGGVTVSGGAFTTTVVGEVERAALPLVWTAQPTWKREKQQLWVEWTVGEEWEVNYYAIEEFADAWRELDRTPARGGQRYASALEDDGGKRLLRIVGVDLDGRRTQSSILEVTAVTKGDPLLVPNPAKDRVRITGLSAEEVVTIELFDASGRRYPTVERDETIVLPQRSPATIYLRITTRNGKVFTRTVIRK